MDEDTLTLLKLSFKLNSTLPEPFYADKVKNLLYSSESRKIALMQSFNWCTEERLSESGIDWVEESRNLGRNRDLSPKAKAQLKLYLYVYELQNK